VEPRLREGVKAYIEEATSYAREAVKACTRCMLCSAGCVSYRALGDRRFSPPERLRLALRVLMGEVRDWRDAIPLYTCTMCRACTVLCPYRLEVWKVVHAARVKLGVEGRSPPSLAVMAENVARAGHSFTDRSDEPAKLLLEAARKAGVSVDEPADYLYVPSAFETTPMYVGKLVNILRALKALGISVTVSPRALDLGGNVAVDAARPDLGVVQYQKCLEVAEAIGAKRLLTAVCGADLKAAMFGEEFFGLRREAGKLHHVYQVVGRSIECRDCVLHASCFVSRFTGFRPPLRARWSRDRPPYTLCCGGGGGVNFAREPEIVELRRRIYAWRASVLPRGRVVTACIKCYVSMSTGLLYRGRRDVRLELVTDVVASQAS
jgi:Fe-S oxidoreductase